MGIISNFVGTPKLVDDAVSSSEPLSDYRSPSEPKDPRLLVAGNSSVEDSSPTSALGQSGDGGAARFQSSEPTKVREALTEVTNSVRRILDTLPSTGVADNDSWPMILEDIQSLSRKRERLVEIERELDETIADIDRVVTDMRAHIDATIESEREMAATYQLRSKVAETMSAMLRNL
jgi:hypothetical protein